MADNEYMDRAEVIELLRSHAQVLLERYGACKLGLFGSAARDELQPDSDIDVLVEFNQPPTVDSYFGTKDYLESVLGRSVDLVTRSGLKPRARLNLERDLVHVT